MKITPKQLREAIDAIRTHQLKTSHHLEYYEAVIGTAPASVLPQMQQDVNKLRSMFKDANKNVRGYAEKLELFLKEDEAMNGWKGEDRYIEFGENGESE